MEKQGGDRMKKTERFFFAQQVIACEIIGFVCIIMFIWLDELLDIPHFVLGFAATPVNWGEALIESIGVVVLGAAIVIHTRRLFLRVKHLEGMLPICTSCKKIRDTQGDWHQVERYIRDHSEVKFSHGLCPACAKALYPDLDLSARDERGNGRT